MGKMMIAKRGWMTEKLFVGGLWHQVDLEAEAKGANCFQYCIEIRVAIGGKRLAKVHRFRASVVGDAPHFAGAGNVIQSGDNQALVAIFQEQCSGIGPCLLRFPDVPQDPMGEVLLLSFRCSYSFLISLAKSSAFGISRLWLSLSPPAKRTISVFPRRRK